MSVFDLIPACYLSLRRRRKALFAAALLAVLLGFAGLMGIEVREDIGAMLPDGRSEVATDFRLLQKAPFSRKVLIHLKAQPGVETALLLQSADRLAAAMGPPYFSAAATGPEAGLDGRLPQWLVEALPNLMTGEDLDRLGEELKPEGIEGRLKSGYARLLSPEGWLLKGLLRRDPLELRACGFEKLLYLNPVPKARLRDNHFLSTDGGSALILAETPVPITDFGRARKLLEHFRALASGIVPDGIEAVLVGGHPYSVANAGAIRDDLAVVLGVSCLAILGLFLVFLRSWRALFVFLVPVSVLGLSAVAVSLAYGAVSGVTLGFGAVLLGITVDFALHVYFAVRHGGPDTAGALKRLGRPLLFGALTTLGAFGVLLLSDLPGQRQLAVFSMTGIAASLLLSVVVLPHLVGSAPPGGRGDAASGRRMALPRRAVLGLWLALLLVCAWQATGVRINGSLRSLSFVPPGIHAAEEGLRRTWGDLRGQAMVFCGGKDLESALAANDRLFAFLRKRAPGGKIVSLAPLLPSEATQRSNRRGWAAFWQQRKGPLGEALRAAGEPLGFSPDAFAPFLEGLEEVPAPVTADDLRRAGLSGLLDALVLEEEGGCQVLTLVPDTPEIAGLFSGGDGPPAGAHLVSQDRFGRELSRAIGGDFARFIALACLAVGALLALLFRDARRIGLALVPVVSGLAVMFGTMGWLGMEFNLFNIVATVLVIGLGVDYGIFMVCRLAEGNDPATERAVLVSGLTTLAGFGALVLARHPALHSIGLSVLLGIGAAVPAALLVIPALWREGNR